MSEQRNLIPSLRMDVQAASSELARRGLDLIERGRLADLTPLTVGIENADGTVSPVIPIGTAIPVSVTRVFSTTSDNQRSIQIRMLQGEWAMAADNALLGLFTIHDIAPAPRGVPQIEVELDIDLNGIFQVTARDTASTTEMRCTIDFAGSGLSKNDIERLRRDRQPQDSQDQDEPMGPPSQMAQFLMETRRKRLAAERRSSASAR